MDAEEKFNSCLYRPDEQVEVSDGCPCKGKKKLVHTCKKRNIINLKATMCDGCDLFENKNP